LEASIYPDIASVEDEEDEEEEEDKGMVEVDGIDLGYDKVIEWDNDEGL
jgi:hypothetical protein